MPLVIKTVVINRAPFSSRNNWIQSEVSCNPQRLLSASWHRLEAKEETDNTLHEKLSLQPRHSSSTARGRKLPSALLTAPPLSSLQGPSVWGRVLPTPALPAPCLGDSTCCLGKCSDIGP